MPQAQPRPKYGAGDSARQLPDYQIPFHGIDYGVIPGYQEIAPYNFEELWGQIFGGGNRGGGGGGGGGGVQATSNPANDYLNQLFGGGINEIGKMNPDFVNNIFGLQGQSGTNFDLFNSTLAQLGNRYNTQIGGTGDKLLEYLMGDAGLGTGGPAAGVGFSGGGGINTLGIGGLLANLPEFQAREIRTALPELSPELASELDIIKQAQLADFERLRSEQNSELMTQLFGRGVQRSTVAGDALNRANESQERTRLQVLSEDVARRLGIRTDEAERILAGDTASLGAEAQTFGNRLQALSSMYGSELGAQASAVASSASAGASAAASRSALEGDRLRALASIYGSQVGGLEGLFGSQVGGLASGFGTQQGSINNFADLFGQLTLGGQGNEINKYLGLGNIAGGILNTQTQAQAQKEASRYSANVQRELGLQQNQLGYLEWMEDVANRFQGGMMDQTNFDLQRELAQLQGDVSRYGARQAGQESGTDWGQILGTLAMAAATYYSDERMKSDICVYDGVGLTPQEIEQITPVFFRYQHDPDIVRSGVLAQQVEKVLPDAVSELEHGYKYVNYEMLLVAILKGYRDFIKNTQNGGSH